MMLASSCGKVPAQHDYGVFLSVTEDLELLQDYKTVVIDAQFFTAKEISNLGIFKGEKLRRHMNLEREKDLEKVYRYLLMGRGFIRE